MRWVKIFADRNAANDRLMENKPQLLVVDGKRICLVKQGDTIYGVSDTCTHNGESLSKGKVNHIGEVICPWHGYQFNLKTGREYQQRSVDVACYPIKEEADGLYIGV